MNTFFYGILSFILYLVSRLPLWFLYGLSDILFFVLYYLVRYRKTIVRTNLANSFPEKTELERQQIEKKYFRFLADTIFETIKLRSISASELKKRFKFKNIEEVNRHLKNHKSVLIATGHYANWEWGAPASPLYFEEPLMVIYKSQSNKYFENKINEMRSRFGAIMVPMQQAYRTFVSQKNEPFLAIFLADQTPVRQESMFFTPFLNQPTPVFLGVEKIAKKTGHPVLFYHMNRIKRGYHEVIFKTLTEDPKSTADYEITKLHTAELERVIRQRPEFWLWSHKRWKFKT